MKASPKGPGTPAEPISARGSGSQGVLTFRDTSSLFNLSQDESAAGLDSHRSLGLRKQRSRNSTTHQ